MAKMGRKGVVNILELIVVVITLFVSFAIFFPRADYRNRWEDAYATLKSRDLALLLERTGRLSTYAFEPELMENFFEILFPETNLILWSETEGAIKKDIKIACDCSGSTITELSGWADGLKLNNRSITITFCSANLGSPGLCIDSSDAMLIWGQKSLQPYQQLLSDYISDDKGIVEVMDFAGQSEVDGDSVQGDIFGIEWIGIASETMDYDKLSEPASVAETIFTPYKYFHNVPFPLKTSEAGISIGGCSYDPAKNGTFNFSGNYRWFAICDESHVWFDTDGDEAYDTLVEEREEVTIGSYTFMLNYINSDSSIAVSFKPDYEFDDFLKYAGNPSQVFHVDSTAYGTDKILVTAVKGSVRYPSVILNRFGDTGVAWIADFSEDGFGDDEKLLLTSLLIWASNKRITSGETLEIRLGYLTSYITMENVDMFEVYKFSLGLGYPF